ncbi:MAG: S-layer homology domain-containing protein [Gudongella sp.]|nr:S-layer homology domain-containing protein [Gudongella sp.]
MRRILSFTLALIMVMGIVVPVSAASPYETQGSFLKDLGVLKGDLSGNLMLESNLTREQMVVLVSRLYGKEKDAEGFVANNVFQDLKPTHSYYIPFILWAKNEGLIQGITTTTFGVEQGVTVQQFQTVLLRALGYTEEAKDWYNVPEFAKQIGMMKGLSFSPDAKLNRGQVSAMLVNALSLPLKGTNTPLAVMLGLNPLDMTESVKIIGDEVVFSGILNDKEELNLLIKSKTTGNNTSLDLNIPVASDGSFEFTVRDLELGTYEYRYYTEKKASIYTDFIISNQRFQLSDAYADNLKEIKLLFNKSIDTTIAASSYNYSTDAGTINRVRFENNDKEVILVLNGTMIEGEDYNIKAENIYSTSGEDLSVNETFGVSDEDIPSVDSIEVLGNKGIRIYFTEPIKTIPSMNNFKLDQTNTLEKPVLVDNHITLSYKAGTSALSTGSYSLEISGLLDYANKTMNSELKTFSVKKDSIPPAITDIDVTTERVTLQFSETLDPSFIQGSNIFQREGVQINYADEIIIRDNRVTGIFESTPLLSKEITLYINSFSDYWGNMMVTKEYKITPKEDTRKPELMSATLSEDGKSIKLGFNKNVKADSTSYYTIKDSEDRVIFIRDINGDGREWTLNLYTTPIPGNITLNVSGIKDLSGTEIKSYKATLNVKDLERPTLLGYTGYGSTIVMEFDKEMDKSSTGFSTNYLITFNGSQIPLPTGTNVSLDREETTLTITLPEEINGTSTMIGTKNNLSSLDVVGLKSKTGNLTNPLILALNFDEASTGDAVMVDYSTLNPGKQAELVEPDTIKLKFNMPIIKASADDFEIDGIDIDKVITNGTNIVTIILKENVTTIEDDSAYLIKKNNIETSIGTGAEYGDFYVQDKLAPILISREADVRKELIEIEFSEELEKAGESLYRRDLEIIRLSDNTILSSDDYSTKLDSGDPEIIIITLDDDKIDSKYTIRVIDSPSYIRDYSGNLVLKSSPIETDDSL